MQTVRSAAPSTARGLVPRADVPPKLASYAAIHDAIIRDLRRLDDLARTCRAGGPPGATAAALRRWWERFVAAIEHHHHREDDLVFPVLAERGAALDLTGLAVDHERLDELVTVVGCSLDAVDGRDPDALEDLSVAATELRTHMDDHLAREEAQVFPVFDRLLEEADAERLERRMRKGTSVSDMSFLLPWLLDDAHPRIDELLHAGAPKVLVVVERLVWRRGYERLAAPVKESAR